MGTRDNTSGRGKGRRQTKQIAPVETAFEDSADDADAPLWESPLVEAIEAERAQLLQAHAVLKCLHEAVLYLGDEDATLYADVAKLAATLIDESVARLDYVRLKPLLQATKISADYEHSEEALGTGARGKNEVRDGGGCVYLC